MIICHNYTPRLKFAITYFVLRIFSFDTSNGIQKEEQGDFSNPGTDQESLVVRGSYSYVDYGGNTISVRYTADESGFHPEGIHITQFARQRSGFPIDAPSPVPQGPYVPYGPQYAQTLK